jgi:glycolate oxidase FAD binding subunit
MTLQPTRVDELQDIICDAAAVRIRAGGTKSQVTPDAHVIDMTRLAGILEYSPEECVFTALAGTSLREITSALGAHGQYLPFDPPLTAEGATIGGTVAAGVSGARRYRYGGIRDFLIGIRVVDGEGRVIRSGGKVVKNAAGFLLHHGVVGSCGRFGVLTEVTFKVFPAPEARRTLSVGCGRVEDAWAGAQRIEQLRLDCEAIDFDEQGVLRVTVAGREEAIDARATNIAAALGPGTVPGFEGCPRFGGQSPNPGTVPASVAPGAVKVAGLMNSWHKLRPHVTSAQFMCAGAVAWLTTDDLAALARTLDEERLVGQIIRGPGAGDRIGHVVHNEFEERVRRVLDPHDRFSAPHHSRH